MDQMQSKGIGVTIARVPSEAIFSVAMNVSYMFGVAMNVSAGGINMDEQRNLELTEALDGDNSKVIQYNIQSGMNSSALESSVPEQLFSTPTNPTKCISAVDALQLANNEGVPIYTVNQSNISTVLPQLQLPSDVISDIQNAVNAGEIVTVSQTEINFNGWIGVGYIIIDPTTGAGAYMISGGLSGIWGVISELIDECIAYISITPNYLFDFAREAIALIVGLLGTAIGAAADAINLIIDIIRGIKNGTTNWQKIAAAIQLFILSIILTYNIMAASPAILVGVGLWAGVLFGPEAVVAAIIIAAVLIVAILVGLYFAIKNEQGKLLGWLKNIIYKLLLVKNIYYYKQAVGEFKGG